jgi:hypothetical protein
MYSLKVTDKLAQDLVKFDKNETPATETHFLDVLNENKIQVRMVLDLIALAPIYSSEYGQSVLCKFTNQEQFSKILEIENLIPEVGDFDAKPFVQDETFFLKLQTKDGKYKAAFDVVVDCNEPEKVPIRENVPLVVFCKPGVWVNLKNGKAGVYLQIEKINLMPEKKPTQRKLKKTT